jgi:hypothetical protein
VFVALIAALAISRPLESRSEREQR